MNLPNKAFAYIDGDSIYLVYPVKCWCEEETVSEYNVFNIKTGNSFVVAKEDLVEVLQAIGDTDAIFHDFEVVVT